MLIDRKKVSNSSPLAQMIHETEGHLHLQHLAFPEEEHKLKKRKTPYTLEKMHKMIELIGVSAPPEEEEKKEEGKVEEKRPAFYKRK